MAYYPATILPFQAFTDNSVVLSGGTIEAYIAGTSTPTNMYTDSAGTSAGTSITLNSRGEPAVSGNTVNIWLDDSVTYKFVLKDASAVTIYTVDNVTRTSSTSADITYNEGGTGADNRTIESRLQDIVSVKDYGPSIDGTTDDAAKIHEARDRIIALGGGILLFPPGNYAVSAVDFDGLTNTKVIAAGAKFTALNSGSGVAVTFQNCTDVEVDRIHVENAGGYETGRSRLFLADTCTRFRVGNVLAKYTTQHLPADNNEGADLWQLNDNDRAIRVDSCSDCWFGHLETINADIGIRVLDCADCEFDNIRVESYMKGLRIDGGARLLFKRGVIRTQTSTFASHLRATYNDWRKDRPGNNGVLIGTDNASSYPNPRDITFCNFAVYNSGEHGFRIAGGNTRYRIKFETCLAKSCGAAGFKWLGDGTTAVNCSMDDCQAIDCTVNETYDLNSASGATQFVYSATGNTITISGIEWPEDIAGKSITITGSTSNNITATVSTRDSDAQITVGSSLTNETDATPSSTIAVDGDNKLSHGFMLYDVLRFTLINPVVDKDDNTYSCEDGIQFSNATDLYISNPFIRQCEGDGISLRPATRTAEYNDCSRVVINGGQIWNCGADGLSFNHEQITVTELHVEGYPLIKNCDTAIRLYDDGTAGTWTGPSTITATISDSTTSDVVCDQANAMFALRGDFSSFTTVRAGSTWHDYTNSQFKVFKAGAWTAL